MKIRRKTLLMALAFGAPLIRVPDAASAQPSPRP